MQSVKFYYYFNLEPVTVTVLQQVALAQLCDTFLFKVFLISEFGAEFCIIFHRIHIVDL